MGKLAQSEDPPIPKHEFALIKASADADVSRAALAALPHPVLLAGRRGTIAALNRAGETFLTALAGAGAPVRKQVAALGAAAAAEGRSGDPITIALTLDGAAICFEVTAHPAGSEAVLFCRDVSAETAVREVLLESRQRYKQLVEIGADFVWECDESGAFSFVSEPGAFGYPPDRLVGRQPGQFLAEAEGTAWPSRVIAPVRGIGVSVRGPDGSPIPLSIDAGPVEGSRSGVRGVGRLLPDVDHRDAARAASDGRMLAILQAMQAEWRPEDALMTCAASVWHQFGAAGCVIYSESDGGWHKLAESGELPPDPSLQRCLDSLHDGQALCLFADPDAQLLGLAVHAQGRRVGALVVWRMPGAPAWRQADVALLGRLDPACGIAVRQAQEIRRLTRLSRSDSLTGLLNRRAFLLELTAALARASRQRSNGALIYIDLDNFKKLNDLCGHEAGNQALTGVAGILGSAIRPYDLAARLGGDEFAVWLEDISGRDARRSARRISAAIADWSAANSAAIGASIGIAMFDPAQPESAEDLIQRADRAMYRAKRARDGQVVAARPRRRTAVRPA